MKKSPLDIMQADISYAYKSKKGARQRPFFAWTFPVILNEIAPDADQRADHISRDQVETEFSNIPQLSNSSTNTETKSLKQQGMRHYDGGWPNNVDVEEREGRVKHCKRVEREEGYLAACHALVNRVAPFLKLNSSIDIFEIYEKFNGPPVMQTIAAAVATPSPAAAVALKQQAESSQSAQTSQPLQKQQEAASPTHPGTTSSSRRKSTAPTMANDGPLIANNAFGSPDDEEEGSDPISSAAHSRGSNGEKPFCVSMKFAAPKKGLQVTQMSFTCGSNAEKMAVGYVPNASTGGIDGYSPCGAGYDEDTMAGAVWGLASCVAPLHILHSRFGGCTAVACCPKDQYQVVGGSATGIVQIWDLRKPSQIEEVASDGLVNFSQNNSGGGGSSSSHHLPVLRSKRLSSHRDVVTEAKYILSKGVDIMTSSVDGRVLFWDLRNMSEPLPDETLDLLPPSVVSTLAAAGNSPSSPAPATMPMSSSGTSLDAAGEKDDSYSNEVTPRNRSSDASSVLPRAPYTTCYIDYDPMVGGVQQYLVATTEGVVLACSRRGKKRSERIVQKYDCSLSSVFTAQRCAALPKVFLTIGDWGWKLFGDEVKTPIMSSAPRLRQVTCGRWHSIRPSIILTGTASGYMEVWDILTSIIAPVETLRVSNAPLRHCVSHLNGRHVATADADGHMYLTTLPESFAQVQYRERSLVATAMEREYNRERALQILSQRNQSISDTFGKGQFQDMEAPTDFPNETEAANHHAAFGIVDVSQVDERIQSLSNRYLSLVLADGSDDELSEPPSPTDPFASTAKRGSEFGGEMSKILDRRWSTTAEVDDPELSGSDSTPHSSTPPLQEQPMMPFVKKPSAPQGRPKIGRF